MRAATGILAWHPRRVLPGPDAQESYARGVQPGIRSQLTYQGFQNSLWFRQRQHMILVDTHCHIHRWGNGEVAASPAYFKRGNNAGNPTKMASGGNDFDNSTADQYVHPLYCLMAVEEADWSGLLAISGRDRKEKKPLLQDVSQNNKEVVAVGLGIHPWKTQNVQSGWEGRLKEALERDPTLIVGEIGLDKARESGKKSWEEQRQIFELQMKLAAELKRPVSVHCVRAYGIVYEWLKGRSAADLPPSVAFHSYTGSLDMAGAFLRLKHLQGSVFFGFSAAVCLRYPAAEAKLRQVLPILPKESLLLESDLDDREAVPGAMNTICDVVAEVKGMERNALAEVTTKNAERFLRRALR